MNTTAVAAPGAAKPPFDRQGTQGDDERLAAAMKSFVSDFGVTVALHLESCVHCGLCAQACHFHLATGDPRHTPSTVKREARKLDTQAMYASWQKAYRDLLKKSPGKSDVWYANQIAKKPISQGRNASTIKKHVLA